MAIEKALRYVVLGGVFALPFIVFLVTQSLFFPFITGKNFAFRIIIEIMSAAWLALAFINPAYRPKRSWILGAFALFVIIIAIADAQGVYPFKSFWSNFERMDGWVTLAHLFAYVVVAASTVNTEKLWRTVWQVSLGISVLIGVYGILQLLGAAALGQRGNSGLTARLDATFGNPIYLAAYMLFHIFMAALLWLQERKTVSGRWTPLTIFYAGAIVLDTFILFFTGTRGTEIGLVGGAVLAGILYALETGSTKMFVRVCMGVGIVAIVGGALHFARDTALVKSVGFLDRIAGISLTDSTVKARFLNWGMALQGVKEKPLLGWGQENYAIVFDKYYDPRMYGQEQWFDRVHNIVFDWLVAGGFLGLLAYLSLYAAALWSLWRASVWSAEERSILTGLLAAYFFHDLFVFDNITSYLLFGMVLAYIAYRTIAASPRELFSPFSIPKGTAPALAAIALVLAGGTVWFVNGNALAADRTLLQAVAPHPEGITKNLEYFKEAIAYNTYGSQEAREQLVQGAAQLAASENVPSEIKKSFFDAATSEMLKQMQESPLDARFPLFLGVVLDSYGDYPDAAQFLQKAHELSLKKQTILYELASNQLARGDTKAALASYKEALELAPENTDARIYYAAAAIRAQNDSLADELLAPIVITGGAADPRIAAAYVARHNYAKIASIWEAHVKAQPQDVQAYFTLAAAYYGSGNSAKAIAVLEEVGEKFPDLKSQADSLIDDIKSGKAKVL